MIRGRVTYDTSPRINRHEPATTITTTLFVMAGLAAATTGYAAVCPTLAHVPAEVVGIWKKLGERVNLMAKHNSRMAKHEPNVAKNDTRKAKHKPRIMTPNVRIIKTRTVRGSSSRFLGFVLLLQKNY
ncbi:hypothetical protein [Prevotella sp. P5-108]|uniref:hypothetical protein n=1 Tax=Prevotella sp. P5-108 TaxID=2024225 RepID=UPI00117EA1B5|nr:hypothetical protein [Prevotella sp. P5-108]